MKKEQIVKSLFMLLLAHGLFLVSCTGDEGISETGFGIFEVIDENTIELDGVINSASLNHFNALIDSYPNINTIHIINYYMSIGFTQQEAEDFYYFTINAAPADDIHWMTDQEIAQYGMLTQ